MVDTKKTSLQRLLLVFIVALAFLLRLYKITSPILDWHSFRQADTASVTREYQKHGINLLEPKYHDLSNVASGMNNPEGYRMVEFPFINALNALLLSHIPISLTTLSRLVSALFSVGTIICFYYLTENTFSQRTALLASFTMAILPYSLFYSRAVLPEPPMLFFGMLALLAFYYWITSSKLKWYVLSVVSLMLAVLLKPYVLFLFPIFISLGISHKKQDFFKNPLVYIYPLIAVTPFIWWREWIEQFPEGIPANSWLFNGDGIRFRPAWFRWLGYERLTKMFLGYSGIFFFIASFFPIKKEKMHLYSWWLGILLYFSVLATGNVRHDYYQYLMIPAVCLSIAIGAEYLYALVSRILERIMKIYPSITFSFLPLSLLVVAMLYSSAIWLSWQQVKGFYNINHPEYIKAGIAAQKLLPENAKVIAPAFSDTQFLFQTDKKGWALGYDIEDKIDLGATHYITTSFDEEAQTLETQYFIIEKTDEYLILDLTRKKSE